MPETDPNETPETEVPYDLTAYYLQQILAEQTAIKNLLLKLTAQAKYISGTQYTIRNAAEYMATHRDKESPSARLKHIEEGQVSTRKAINAIGDLLKKDAEKREETYFPVRFLCWVQIVCMATALFGVFVSVFVGARG